MDPQSLPEDHEKINFYGRIEIFMKFGCSRPKSTHKRSPSSDHDKINFYCGISIFMKFVLTAQIDSQALPELRS